MRPAREIRYPNSGGGSRVAVWPLTCRPYERKGPRDCEQAVLRARTEPGACAEMERDPTVFVLGEDKRLLRARRFHFNLIWVLGGTNAMHCRGHRTGRKLSRATTR